MKIRSNLAFLALFGVACSLWAAPIPTVYWDGDFDVTEKTGTDGVKYTFDSNGNTVDGGKLVIGSTAGLIGWSESSGTNMTVLIKYSSLELPTAPCTLLSFKTSADDDLGVRATSSGSSTLVGYNTSGGTAKYGTKNAANPSGYLVLTYDSSSKIAFQSALTEAKFSSSSFSSTELITTSTMSGIALGGPNASDDYPAWSGVVIEAVAVFRGYYSNSTGKYIGFRFPSELTTYSATISGDVANLQTDGTIAWSGTALPSGGSADAAVIWNMAAAASIAPTAQTKMFSLALTGSGNATFPGTAKNITTLQVFDLSDYSGVADINPGKSHSADASIKVGPSATLVLKKDSGTVTVNGQIFCDGTLIKSGSGTVTLGSACSLAGATTVNEGTLTLNAEVTAKSVSNFGTVNGSSRLVVSDALRGTGIFSNVTALAGVRIVPTDGTAPLRIYGDFNIPTGGIVIDATEVATDEAAKNVQTVKVVQTSRQLSDSDISTVVHGSTHAWSVSREQVGSDYLISLAPSTMRLKLEWRGGSGDWSTFSFDGQGGYDDSYRQAVTFCDSAEGSDPLTVTVVNGPRTVSELAFSNNTRSVTLTGGAVSASQVKKLGKGEVTVSSPLTISSGLVIAEGTLVLEVPAGTTTTITGGISGKGNLVKLGDGMLDIVGSSASWSGTLTVNGGVVRCGTASSFGTSEVIVNGGTVDLNGKYLNNPLAIAGSGFGDNGAIINSGADLTDAPGLAGLRLIGDATIGGDAGSYLWIDKTIDLAGHALTKTGSFKWTLSSNAFAGNGRIIIDRGTFDISQGINDLSAASLAIQSRAIFIIGDSGTVKVIDFACISTYGIDGEATIEVSGTLDTDGAVCTIPNLVFADNATIKGNGLIVGKSLAFDGTTMNVNGIGSGSVALRYKGDEPTGYDRVTVRVVGDSSRTYSFECDTDTKSLLIVANPITPTFDMSSANVVYGVDMTNAVVKFNVTNYTAGVGYTGSVRALLTVRDATGRVVAERGLIVTGDGEYAFDLVDLFNGRTAGYSYDISVISREGSTEADERINGGGASEYVVHWSTNWFSESAAAFKSPTTGKWTAEPAASAYVTNNFIRHGVDGGKLLFTANRASKQNVVRVTSTILVQDGTDVPAVTNLPAEAHVAFSVAFDYSDLVYVALTPALPEPVRLYSTGPSPRPIAGTTSAIAATFNYADGTVTFTADGNALTNAEGSAYLPISEVGKKAGKLQNVRFEGLGYLKSLEGDELNANLAKVGDTEYATLDEAIAALPEGGTVEMLWDALWHPTMKDFGKRYFFTGDHSVVLDTGSTNSLAATGYNVVPNGDGSYSVSVIEYKLTFSANGASAQEDYAQSYTVTNLVFALLANRFSSTNVADFVHWNAAADGSANTNYTDCATIDMGQYGLTNMTLYAQWKTSVRTITIATPDPYVYLELVTTNSAYNLPAAHNGVRFYKRSGAGSEVSATFGVEHGSRVAIYFSTDIEKQLDRDNYQNLKSVERNREVSYNDLPKIKTETGLTALSTYERWAVTKGIGLTAFSSSQYAMASYSLDTDELMNEKTVVELADFAVLADGCSFRVLIDGVAVSDRAAIADMIMVSDDLANWTTPAKENVVIDGETIRVITSGSGKFVKVVVPQD